MNFNISNCCSGKFFSLSPVTFPEVFAKDN